MKVLSVLITFENYYQLEHKEERKKTVQESIKWHSYEVN